MPAVSRPSAELNMMYLDGKEIGFLKSVEGGAVSAEIITESVGTENFVRKHISGPQYEELLLKFSFSMAKPMYDWIAAAWKKDYKRKNGSIIAADFDYKARSEREFQNALITEVNIPAMDGSSKEAAYFTVKIKPELIRARKGSGQNVGQGIAKPEQKAWLASNFRLEIPGLECKRVAKIDSFTVKQGFTASQIGDHRDHEVEPAKLEFPNLRITLAEVDAQSWLDWHNDFVIMGKNGEADEKTGALVFLSSDRQTELGRINFLNLGIFRLDREAAEGDQIRRLVADLYCQRMELVIAK